MNTLIIGKNFVELPQVESTNRFLIDLLAAEAAEGMVVYSPNQTAGRGQQGKEWHTEPGKNIACSVLLRPVFLSPNHMFVLNKAVAVAIRDAIQSFLPDYEVLIKWPNDILVAGKKVCGILIENQMMGTRFESSVVGFGINVNQMEFDSSYGSASSLALLSGRTFSLREVLEAVLVQLDRRYLELRAQKWDGLERLFLSHLYAYQTETELMVDGVKLTGIPIGVDAHGRLAVQIDGALRYFGIKEISFIL